MEFRKLFTYLLLLILFQNCDENVVVLESAQIIPLPQTFQVNEGYFRLNTRIGISKNDEFKVSSEFLKSFFTQAGLQVVDGEDIIFIKDEALSEESYRLVIVSNQIKIEAKTDKAAFYAIQSLRQILPPSFEESQIDAQIYDIPTLKIVDEPKFSYRGMHLDVGRHFFSVDFIKSYIDALAMLKMNTFHWHLTEDQGWRIEIKKYPKLQEIAAFRSETLVGHYSDQPHQFDGTPYGGFYTQEQIKEVVAYALERFVTVIPEIEMPGHSQAALAAYPELGCTGNTVEVATKWGVFEEIYCTKEATFEFLENVLDEVIELFPSKYIHIGGDEAPKTRWKECPNCQKRIAEEGLKDEHELQNYFISRMEAYLNSKGRQIIGWDEILEGGLAPNATVMSWRGTNGAVTAAKQKHNVIMTPTSHCYFDYYQSEGDNEPTAIGGFLPLEKVYDFNPIPEELNAEEAKYVLGAQGNLWTEYMPTEDQVEYMAVPRIFAMSEVLWTGSDKKDFEAFVGRVENFHKRLDVLDINYANHLYELQGQMISNAVGSFYDLTSLSKGKSIHYTLDGSLPDANSKKYEEPIPIDMSLVISAQVFENQTKLGSVLVQSIHFHKGVGAVVRINKDPHRAYSGSGPQGLVNGISGSNKRFGDKEWLGFWGEDIEITIELPEEIEINSISTRFHNGNGQWIYAPEEIDIEIEGEVEKFKLSNSNQLLVNFDYTGKTKAKKVKLRIKNYGTIPQGKQGAGNKAWTFIDEIIIN